MQFLIAVFLYLSRCGLCLSQELTLSTGPRVNTPLGLVEGYYKTSSSGRRYKAYEGIPYAQPPIGNLRFQVARSVLPWNGVLMAKLFSPTCVQYFPLPGQKPPGIVIGLENCLYLNIYTPIAADGGASSPEGTGAGIDLLPVIFFIHGGGFQYGAGSQYGPKYLLDKNITLVTINYRLGPLGFLSTEDETVPGNMGLKDQVIALRWVKDNIRYFGGDPSRVTIVGQSAGAVSVHYHLLSNLSSGLFQRGMSLSGTALNCWAQTEGSLEKAKKLATIVGCPSRDVRRMVECMRNRPAIQIMAAIGQFMPFGYNPFTPFGPVVEKGGGNFTFIDRPPIETLTSGKPPRNHVPWITSLVSAEGLAAVAELITRPRLMDELNRNWETIAPYLLDFHYTIPEKDQPAVARLIRQHYLGTSPIDKSTVNQTVQMIGDRMLLYNAEEAARLQAQADRITPVRFYYFSYRGAHSTTELFAGTSEEFGVSHADDLVYVMDSFFDPTTTPRDRAVQQVLINLWVSFATDSSPDVGVEWQRLGQSSADDFRYLHIAGPEDIGMESPSNFGDKNFWRTIGFQENVRRPTNSSKSKQSHTYKVNVPLIGQLSLTLQ